MVSCGTRRLKDKWNLDSSETGSRQNPPLSSITRLYLLHAVITILCNVGFQQLQVEPLRRRTSRLVGVPQACRLTTALTKTKDICTASYATRIRLSSFSLRRTSTTTVSRYPCWLLTTSRGHIRETGHSNTTYGPM